jgi:hypothetical protein
MVGFDSYTCTAVYEVQTTYSVNLFIQHFWDQRVAECCSLPDVRTLYLMCVLVYLATSGTERTV